MTFSQVDVAIVTALCKELEPVLCLIDQQVDGRSTPYFGRFDTPAGALTIAATTLDRAGGDSIIAAIYRILNFHPRLVVMTGICAGPREKVKLGDLIVAEFAFHEKEGKDTDEGFKSDGRTYEPHDPKIITWAKQLPSETWQSTIQVTHPDAQATTVLWHILKEGPDTWRERNRARFEAQGVEIDLIAAWLSEKRLLKKSNDLSVVGRNWLAARCDLAAPTLVYDSSALHKPRVEVAPAVQSPSVIAREGYFKENQLRARKLRMCDMESASFYATLKKDEHQVAGLVVKSVVDHADGEKDDRFHRYGSEVAAQWLAAFLRRYAERIRKLPTTFSSNNGGGGVTFTLFGSPLPMVDPNRAPMIAKVRSIWIEQLLRKAVIVPKLRRRLVEHPAALVFPFAQQYQEVASLPASDAPETPGELIVRYGRTLLILGPPGVGKTIFLLELAEHLLAEAEVDSKRAIPVVFNLSSWAEKRQSLDHWLREELRTRYNVWTPTARKWINKRDLLPMLDGLDEVNQAQRDACLEAINEYVSKSKQSTDIMVCCREEEYAQLSHKLCLGHGRAVRILPLDNTDLDHALARAGPQADVLRQMIRHDILLQELIRLPLYHHIVLQDLREEFKQDVASPPTTTIGWQSRIFASYINRMLSRRKFRYEEEASRTWLHNLAHHMIFQGITIFQIEHMQPAWLPTLRQQVLALWSGVLWSAILGTIVLACLAGVGRVFFEFLSILLIAIDLNDSQPLQAAINLTILIFRNVSLRSTVLLGSLMGGLLGMVSMTQLSLAHYTIQPVQSWRWSWKQVWGWRKFFMLGSLLSYLFLIPVIWLGERLGWSNTRPNLPEPFTLPPLPDLTTPELWIYSLFWSTIVVLFFASQALLFAGYRPVEGQMMTKPNEGIYRSAWQGLRGGLIFGVGSVSIVIGHLCIESLTSGLIGQLFGGALARRLGDYPGKHLELLFSGDSLNNMFLWVFTIVLALGLISGWAVCLQHLTLRFFLHRNGTLPKDLIPFLDYAVECQLMQRVGSGYIFRHRELMDYLSNSSTNSHL